MRMKKYFFRAMFFISIIAIEFLATTTTVHIEIVENIWDKANHFIAFFTLYILISLETQKSPYSFRIVQQL